MIIITYIVSKIKNLIYIKIFSWIMINIIILYGPIENRYPYFLFKIRMCIKQIIEGIFGIICCFIPWYEPKKRNG